MDAIAIIEEIYRSEDLRECLSRIRPVEVQQDVLQHVFMELLEKDPELIIDLHTRHQLKKYVVTMLFNSVKWERSSFNKMSSKEILFETFNDICEEQPEVTLKVPLEKIYWYDAKLLELYAEHGTYRKVAEITGLEFTGIFKTIQKAKKEIKKHIDYDETN